MGWPGGNDVCCPGFFIACVNIKKQFAHLTFPLYCEFNKNKGLLKMNRYLILGYIIGVLALSAYSGCASNTLQPMPESYTSYRAEMLFSIGTRNYRGLAVTAAAPEVVFKLHSPIPLDRLEISTCGRHEVFRDVDPQTGWFGKTTNGYEMSYTYRPTEQEMVGNCPIMVQAFSKGQQKAWGMMYFRHGNALPSEMMCNGLHWDFMQVAICQSKAGLEQAIKFATPVIFEATANCSITTTDNKTFLVRSKKEFCNASFTDGTNYHDMVLLGYKQVINY